jgi:hypothetical protein
MRNEASQRMGVLRFRIMEIRGQRASLRIEMAIRQLGLQYAGSAGAEKHADARRTVFVLGRIDRGNKPVLFQTQLG